MEGYVAAVDLGTSKVLAMAARKTSKGELEVIEAKSLPAGGMCRGRIRNAEAASNKVYMLMNSFGAKLSPGLKQIYVGIGGQGLHTEPYEFTQEINGTVAKEMLEYLEADSLENPNYMEIVARKYYLDGVLTPEPLGQICKEIKLECLQVLARPNAEERTNLEKVLSQKSEVEVAKFFVSPLATAEAALTKQQKKDGIALVEIGAALTYVSVYKDGQLKLLVTIPLGGDVITRDISALGYAVAEAEELKRSTGIVLGKIEDDMETPPVSKTIQARAVEICANVVRQIQKSGNEASLKGQGIILTGGGAQLRNFDKLLAQESGLPVQWAPIEDHTQACVRGLLLLGTENCAGEEKETVKKEEKSKPPKGHKTNLVGWVGRIFDDID
jgi:cell division protein FtsA